MKEVIAIFNEYINNGFNDLKDTASLSMYKKEDEAAGLKIHERIWDAKSKIERGVKALNEIISLTPQTDKGV